MSTFLQKNSKKIFWVSIITAALLSYGFLISQVSIGIDDEAYGNYFGNNSLAAQGRVGYILIRFLADIYKFTPVWRETLGVLVFIGVVVLLTHLLRNSSNGRFSTAAATVSATVTLSFPLLAERFLFSECVFSTPFQWLLCASGLGCLLAAHRERGRRRVGWLLGAVAALSVAMLFEKTVVAACMTMAFQIAIVTQMNPEGPYYQKCAKLFQLLAMLLATFAAGYVLSSVGTSLLRMFVGVSDSGYVDRYMKYDWSSPLMSLAWTLKTVAERLLSGFQTNEAFRTFLIALVLFFAAGIALAVQRKNPWLGLCAAAYCVLPFAPYIVTANPDLPTRILDYWALWTGFAAAAAFAFLHALVKSPRTQTVLGYAAMFLCVLCVLRQSYAMTQLFYVDYRKYEQDVNRMQQIVNDLQLEVGAELDKPVLFIGCMSESEYVLTDEVAGSSIFGWDRKWSPESELSSGRIYDFFAQHGYTLRSPAGLAATGEAYREFQETVRIRATELSNWPENGYLREYPEYILVRLGPPLYEIYTLSRDEFLEKFDDSTASVEGDFWCEGDNSMVCGGWYAFLGENSWGANLSLVLLNEEEDCQYVVAATQVDRADINEYLDDGYDYTQSGFSMSFNLSGITPGNYQLGVLLQNGQRSRVVLQNNAYCVW